MRSLPRALAAALSLEPRRLRRSLRSVRAGLDPRPGLGTLGIDPVGAVALPPISIPQPAGKGTPSLALGP